MRHRVTWLVTSVSPGGCEGCGPNTLSSDWTLSDLSNKSHAQPSQLSVPPSHGPVLDGIWCQVRCYNTHTGQSEACEARQWPIRGRHGFCHHPVSRVTRNNLLWHSLPVTNVTQQTPSPPSLLASRHKPIFMSNIDLNLRFCLPLLKWLKSLLTNEERAAALPQHTPIIFTAVPPAEQ